MGISDRICQIPASAAMVPARCVLCGKPAYQTNESFLDIRVLVDGYGNIYFCIDCAQELGVEAGLSPKQFKIKYEEARKLNLELQAQLESFDNIKRFLDGYNALNASSPNPMFSDSPSSNYNAANEAASNDEQELEPDFDDFAYGFAAEGTESSESTEVTRPDDSDESANSDQQLTFSDLPL